ncbi:hypothetical protein RUMHYD_02610 [Blautia hydrogenotrophica DSM 10507]|uniref:Uncharacterized protein n=1 Tax=Blautia hydrogenotrophica (strain DSM 10507 / JCM 14656 / S5a33) TaxID=476272 RepID=C0CP09_BLAHS|nr:hypothetical protein RUMHYD_02610 [Blautia hydrogenotrophica DSM 10507]
MTLIFPCTSQKPMLLLIIKKNPVSQDSSPAVDCVSNIFISAAVRSYGVLVL